MAVTKVGEHFKVLRIILVRDTGGLDHKINLEGVKRDKILDIFGNSAKINVW